MKFLFWNIADKDDASIGNTIIDIIKQEAPDVLLLSESNVTDAFILKNCNMNFIHGIAKTSFGLNKRLRLYSSSKTHRITFVTEYGDGEILVCGLEITNGTVIENYLLFGCHFVSKSTIKDEGKRLKRIVKYREFIETTEKDYAKPPIGNAKNFKGSIVFGDFNTNPFELAFIDSTGLFALDVRKPVPKKLNKFKYFINPSLSLLGNFCYNKRGKQAAPGTYFFNDKDIEVSGEHYWNLLDGMFFRPELNDAYENGEPLEVITEIKRKKGVPKHQLFDFKTHRIDEANYSDHLPIKFKFKL